MRDGRTVTLWNRDFGAQNTDTNLYGSHPVLIELRSDGSAHGLFVASSNGMDVVLGPESVSFKCASRLCCAAAYAEAKAPICIVCRARPSRSSAHRDSVVPLHMLKPKHLFA